MSDLRTMDGLDVLVWLAQQKHPVDAVGAFVAHGITDTDVIDARIDDHEHIAALPADARLTGDDLDMLEVIGPRAWYEDPENRSDWAGVACALADLKVELDKFTTTSRRYHDPAPHQSIAAALDAGRGPQYVQRMIALAARHYVNASEFGFDLSPTEFSDLLEAGVVVGNELAAYRHTGLKLPDIIEFASLGIPPAAIMQAIHEDVHRASWRDTLAGLPRSWFYDAATSFGGDGDFKKWKTFIKSGHTERETFTLADLRYLVDHGWDGRASLHVWGLSSTALPMNPETSRLVADHGLTWNTVEDYGKALNTGKTAYQASSSDRTAPAIIGGGGGKAWGVRTEHVPQIAALVAAGVKPSHITAYRMAGCRTIDDILAAAKEGITHTDAKRLTKDYGRKPSKYHNTHMIDSLKQLLAAHAKDQEKTP